MCLLGSKEGTPHGARRRRKFVRDLRFMSRALADFEPRRLTVKLDGQDLTDDYLLCEIMNTGSIGPRLPLVCDADPWDGLLDVVLVSQRHRELLRRYLLARSSDEPRLPRLPVRRARRVEISVGREPLRIDDSIMRDRAQPTTSLRRDGPSTGQLVEIILKRAGLGVLLPCPDSIASSARRWSASRRTSPRPGTRERRGTPMIAHVRQSRSTREASAQAQSRSL
jgi:hypothetical protein